MIVKFRFIWFLLGSARSANIARLIRAPWRRCRHPAGANPARQLSLQPVAIGAVEGGNDFDRSTPVQRAALGGLATMWAATRVNVEQASKRATRRPTRRISGKAGTGRKASDPGRRSRTCGTGAPPAACEPSAPGRAIPGCSQPAPPQGRAGVPPRAAAPARRPTRSTRPRNRRSPSCVVRLEDRTGEGYLRSWRAWRFRCLGGSALDNELLSESNDSGHVRRYFIPGCRISRARVRLRPGVVQKCRVSDRSLGSQIISAGDVASLRAATLVVMAYVMALLTHFFTGDSDSRHYL